MNSDKMWTCSRNQQLTGVNHSELPLMRDITYNNSSCSRSTSSSSHHLKMRRGDRPLFHRAPHFSSRKFSTAQYCSSTQFTPQNIGQCSDGRKSEAPLFTNMNGIRNGYENQNDNVIGNILQLQAIDNAYYRLPTTRLSCNAAATGNRYHKNPTPPSNYHHHLKKGLGRSSSSDHTNLGRITYGFNSNQLLDCKAMMMDGAHHEDHKAHDYNSSKLNHSEDGIDDLEGLSNCSYIQSRMYGYDTVAAGPRSRPRIPWTWTTPGKEALLGHEHPHNIIRDPSSLLVGSATTTPPQSYTSAHPNPTPNSDRRSAANNNLHNYLMNHQVQKSSESESVAAVVSEEGNGPVSHHDKQVREREIHTLTFPGISGCVNAHKEQVIIENNNTLTRGERPATVHCSSRRQQLAAAANMEEALNVVADNPYEISASHGKPQGAWGAFLQYQADCLVEQSVKMNNEVVGDNPLHVFKPEILSRLPSPPYPVMPRPNSDAPLAAANLDPLPLLTEVEDYNESDPDDGQPMVDDDGSHIQAMDVNSYALDIDKEIESKDQGRRESSVFKAEAADSTITSAHDDDDDDDVANAEVGGRYKSEQGGRTLSQKYRPKVWEDVVGQSVVIRALSNAISKGRIAPVYLFHGPRGTGKTSTARIFASALTCVPTSSRSSKPPYTSRIPCMACKECVSVACGISAHVKEVDAASNNGIERVKILLQLQSSSRPSFSASSAKDHPVAAPPPRFKVFIIDECHALTSDTWNALLNILEEPPFDVVFILITTDPDRLPRTAMSRCHRFPFAKIKEADIVERLQALSRMESLDIGIDTLQLIASRADGSLRDALTILDQISLLENRTNPVTLVNQLVGVASNESVLRLLGASLRGESVATVEGVRELVDSGMEPLCLMSTLATLVTHIIAGGSLQLQEPHSLSSLLGRTTTSNSNPPPHSPPPPLAEKELRQLCLALKTLSEAERQVQAASSASERTTWLMAALLRLSDHHHHHHHDGPASSSAVGDSSCPPSAAAALATYLPASSKCWGRGRSRVVPSSPAASSTGSSISTPSIIQSDDDREDCPRSADDSATQEIVHNDGMDLASGCSFLQAAARLKTTDHQRSEGANNVTVERSVQQTAMADALCMDLLYVEDLNRNERGERNVMMKEKFISAKRLDEIWCKALNRCSAPPALTTLFHSHAKLVSIAIAPEVDRAAMVHVQVSHPDLLHTSMEFRSMIAHSLESILCFPIILELVKTPLNNVDTAEDNSTDTRRQHHTKKTLIKSKNRRLSDIRFNKDHRNSRKHLTSNQVLYHQGGDHKSVTSAATATRSISDGEIDQHRDLDTICKNRKLAMRHKSMEALSHGGGDGISGTAPGMWTADCRSTFNDRMLMTNRGTDNQCMNHHEKKKMKKQKMMMMKKKKKKTKINSRETPLPSPSPSPSPSPPSPPPAAASAPSKGLINNIFKAAAGTFARFFKGNK